MKNLKRRAFHFGMMICLLLSVVSVNKSDFAQAVSTKQDRKKTETFATTNSNQEFINQQGSSRDSHVLNGNNEAGSLLQSTKTNEPKIKEENNQESILSYAPLQVKDAFLNRRGIDQGTGVGIGAQQAAIPLQVKRYLDEEKVEGRRVFNAAALGGSKVNEREIESALATPFEAADTVSDTLNLTRFRKQTYFNHYRAGMAQSQNTVDFSQGNSGTVFNAYLYMAEYTEGLTFFMRPQRQISSADYYDYQGADSTKYEVQGLGAYYHGSKENPEQKNRVTGIQDAMLVAFDNWSNDGHTHLGSDSSLANSETKGKSHLSVYNSNKPHVFKPELANENRNGAAQRWAVYAGNGYFNKKWFKFSLANIRAHYATINIQLLTATTEENLASFDVDLRHYIDGYNEQQPPQLVWGFTATMDTSLQNTNKQFLNKNMIFFSDFKNPDHTMTGILQQDAFLKTDLTTSLANKLVKKEDVLQQEVTFKHTSGNLPFEIHQNNQGQHGIAITYRNGKEAEEVVNDKKITFEKNGVEIAGTYQNGQFYPQQKIVVQPKEKLTLRYDTKIKAVPEGTTITKIPKLKGSYQVEGNTMQVQFTTEALQYTVTEDTPPVIAWDEKLNQFTKIRQFDFTSPNLKTPLNFYLKDEVKKNETLKVQLAKKEGKEESVIWTKMIANNSEIKQQTLLVTELVEHVQSDSAYSLQVIECDASGKTLPLVSNKIYLQTKYTPELRFTYVSDQLHWQVPLKAQAEILPHQSKENLRIEILDTRPQNKRSNWYLTLQLLPAEDFIGQYSFIWRDDGEQELNRPNMPIQINAANFQTEDNYLSQREYAKEEGLLLKTNPLQMQVKPELNQIKVQWQLHDVPLVE